MADLISKIFIAAFTKNGDPVLGLSPVVRIREDDGSLIVTDGAMVEVGDGAYKYTFTSYDSDKTYSVRADAGTTDVDIQYMFGTNDNFKEDIQTEIIDQINQIAGGAVAVFD